MAVNAYDRASYSQLKLPTFQEMMIAPQYLTEQHEMAQARADELLSEAQKVELAAMENPNGKAAQLYQGYTQRLNEAVNSLNERGINASNIKANLGRLKADYNAQIAPIAQAWEQQRKDKEAYNAMTAKDRSLITAYDPSQTSIDAYLGRNNASYIPQGISGNEIAQRVAMAAKPYSDWISQKLPEISKTGLPYKYFTMVQKGFSPGDVAAAMRDDGIDAQTASEGALMLKDLRDNVIASSGAYELFGNNPEAIDRLIQYANTGLSQAIGTKQFGQLEDTAGLQAEADYRRDRLARARAADEKKKSTMPAVNMLPGVKVEDTKRGKELLEKMQSLDNPEIKSVLQGITKVTPEYKKLLTNRVNELETYLQEAWKNFGASARRNSMTEEQYQKASNALTGTLYRQRQELTQLKDVLDLIKDTDKNSGTLENYSGNNLYEKLQDKYRRDINSLAVQSYSYTPELADNELIINKMRQWALDRGKYKTIEILDENDSPETKFLSSKPKTLNSKEDVYKIFDKNSMIRYAPSSGGWIITTEKGQNYRIPQEMFPLALQKRFNHLDKSIRDSQGNIQYYGLEDLYKDASEEALMRANALEADKVRYLIDEANLVNQVASKSSKDAITEVDDLE